MPLLPERTARAPVRPDRGHRARATVAVACGSHHRPGPRRSGRRARRPGSAASSSQERRVPRERPGPPRRARARRARPHRARLRSRGSAPWGGARRAHDAARAARRPPPARSAPRDVPRTKRGSTARSPAARGEGPGRAGPRRVPCPRRRPIPSRGRGPPARRGGVSLAWLHSTWTRARPDPMHGNVEYYNAAIHLSAEKRGTSYPLSASARPPSGTDARERPDDRRPRG